MGLFDDLAGYEHRPGGMHPYKEAESVPRVPPPQRKQFDLSPAKTEVFLFTQETAQNAVTIHIEALSIAYSCGAGAGTRTIYVALVRKQGNEIWAAPLIENASLNGTLVYLSHGIDNIEVAAGVGTAMYRSLDLPDFYLRDGMKLWIACTMFAGDVAIIDCNYREVVT